MGNYQESKNDKVSSSTFYTSEGISDFASTILKASEIEYIDAKKIQKTVQAFNYPITFLLINISIDRVLESMKEAYPGRLPPIKEFKKTEEVKKK